VVTSHNVILLASGDIERDTSIRLFPLNIYLPVPSKLLYRYLGNTLPGYGSPNCLVTIHCVVTAINVLEQFYWDITCH